MFVIFRDRRRENAHHLVAVRKRSETLAALIAANSREYNARNVAQYILVPEIILFWEKHETHID